MLSRIATFSHTKALLAASMKVQAKYADQQNQQATGQKSVTYGGLGLDTGKVLNLATQTSRLDADNAAASAASSFVQAAYSAVGQVTDLATTIKSQLASMMGSSNLTAATVTEYATGWLTELQNQLNSQFAGDALFAGQATGATAADFKATAYDPLSNPTAPATGYYGGTTSPRTFTASDGTTTDLSVTANSPAFEQLARALTQLVAAPTDTATLSNAFDLVGQSVADLGTTQEKLSMQASSLDGLTTRNTAKLDTLSALNTQLTGADLGQATVLLTQYQTQLQAMYSTMTSLSQNSLLKYL
jgi:flagellar hook-associated protein 3 FlgL